MIVALGGFLALVTVCGVVFTLNCVLPMLLVMWFLCWLVDYV